MATHLDGRTVVEFSKPPLPLVLLQTTPAAWSLEFVARHKLFRGSGQPPTWSVWPVLPDCLSGRGPARGWIFERTDPEGWRLQHSKSGERLEGYFTR